ncbi:glycosyltransferase family 39 protein [candidate division CSSED10-310 bacterium]|uniref:Glycosyltransferase family 39 protein n=1 Tax=candidate division CSSED10-310 bacterium TaxID=2855610 RepID=A0ABV6Z5L6_UNCC1
MDRYKLLIVVFLALLLRLPALLLLSMTGDEISTVYQASFSFRFTLSRLAFMDVAGGDIAPPLYYIILNRFLALFPFTVWATRLLSVAFDLVTIIAAYFLVQQEDTRETALYSALFIACSPFQIWYGTEIRMYALIPLFTVLSTFSLVKFMRQGKGIYLLYYWFCATLGMYTQYYFALLIGAHFLVGLWTIQRPKIVPFLGAFGAIGLSFLPWLKPFFIDLSILKTQSFLVPESSPLAFFYLLVKLFFFGNRFFVLTYPLIYGGGVLIIVVLFCLYLQKFRSVNPAIKIISLICIAAIGFLSIIFLVKPLALRPHATIFLLPLLLITTAYLTVQARKYGILLRLSIFIMWGMILLLYNYNPLFSKPRVQEGAEIIIELNQQKNPVVNLPLQIPCPRDIVPGSFKLWEFYLQNRCPLFFVQGETASDLFDSLKRHLNDSPNFILVYFQHFQPPVFYTDLIKKIEGEFRAVNKIVLESKVDTFPIVIIFYEKIKAEQHHRSGQSTAGKVK